MRETVFGVLLACCFLFCLQGAEKRDYKDYRGYRVLTIKPEPGSNLKGMYHTTRAAFRLHNFEMVESGPEILEKPENLAGFDLIYLGTIRVPFTQQQTAGLAAYLEKKGSVYANFGGQLRTPELMKLMGLAKRKFIRITDVTLDRKFWGEICKDNKLIHPDWVGHIDCRGQTSGNGFELHALNKEEEIAWDARQIPVGVFHRSAGGGRALSFGFVPENNKSFVEGQIVTKKMLEKIYSVLLPDPPRNPDRSGKVELVLPSICQLKTVKVNGKSVSASVRPFGSVQWVKLPLNQLKAGKEAEVVIDFKKNGTKNIIPGITFPNGNHIYFDHPSKLVDFMKYMHGEAMYSLLHNSYARVYYSKHIPEERSVVNSNYQGDFLKDFLVLGKKNGIVLNGGFYFSFSKVARDKSKPTRIGKDGKPFKDGWRVCLLDEKTRELSLKALRKMLEDYPEIDRLELDDNFEMDGNKSCYCENCVKKFHQEYPGVKPGPESPEWDRFWRKQGETLLKQVLAITQAAGKKLNGARVMWVEPGNTHSYLARHCAMIYEYPAYSCSEGIRVLPERGAYSTILWGMERDLKEIDPEVREAVFGGSVIISYWLHFFKRKDSDNRWGIGTPQDYKEMKLPNGRLMHGTFEAVSKANARLEEHFRDYLAQYLLQGDSRYTVTKAVMDKERLHVTIRNTGKLTSAVTGSVDFAEFFSIGK